MVAFKRYRAGKIRHTGGSGEKSPSKDMKKFFFQFSNLSQPVFLLETQPIGAWKLQCVQFL